MENTELLQAMSGLISKVIKTELEPLKSDISEIKSDMAVLKSDVAVLKSDVAVLKSDVTVLKSDVTVLKSDVAVLKSDVAVLKSDVAVLKSDVTTLQGTVSGIQDSVKRLELINENEILPRLQNIEECYISTYERYAQGISQIGNMQTDITLLKKVVTGHSEQLDKLQKIS